MGMATSTTIKLVVGGLALFGLGGLSVYFLTAPASTSTAPAANISHAATHSAAISPPTISSTADTDSTVMTSESFYAAAEARREQQLADKAEADRIAKLKAIKERSVECTFWKQQQKTSSAAAKIDEKINEHCNLPSSSSASESSNASESGSTGSRNTDVNNGEITDSARSN